MVVADNRRWTIDHRRKLFTKEDTFKFMKSKLCNYLNIIVRGLWSMVFSSNE